MMMMQIRCSTVHSHESLASVRILYIDSRSWESDMLA